MSEDDSNYKIPIDERRIFTESSEPTIKDLCDRINKGKLITQADFQREYVWESRVELKSKLIESVLLKVPIPVVYTAEREDDKEVVVDGQQRLRTFLDFCKKDGFRLKKLRILNDINDKSYSELSERLQDKIDSYPIRVVKIQKESHAEIKFDIFERLNRGSVKLNNQELRNCIYRGSLNTMLKNMVNNKDFLSIQNLDVPDKRMKDAERVLRFLAFVDKGVQNYKSPIKSFLNNYMEEKLEIAENEKTEKIELFKKCSELCKIVFGELTAHRWIPVWNDSTSSMGKLVRTFNDGILDVQMIGFMDYQKRDIVPYAQVIKDAYIDLVCTPEFIETVEIGTYSTKTTKKRMEMWLSKLREVVDYPSGDPRLFTSEDKQKLFSEKDGNICSLCNNKIMDIDDAHVDHIKRYSDGGETKIDNAQITHRYCNLRKG